MLSAVSILADQSIVDAVNRENPMDMTGAMANALCTENYGWDRNALNKSQFYNMENAALNNDVYSSKGIE